VEYNEERKTGINGWKCTQRKKKRNNVQMKMTKKDVETKRQSKDISNVTSSENKKH
jgi:hypothetical protein